MKVFFDANILTSFFRLSNEDIQNIQRLVSGARTYKFEIVTTQLLKDEYERFREKSVGEGLNAFSKDKISTQFPPFVRSHAKFDETFHALEVAKEKLDELRAEILNQAKDHSLLIDDVISELFAEAKQVKETKKLIKLAILRNQKGNPPRKKNDVLGDALHWESLLSYAKKNETLALISRDGDFESELVAGTPKTFLASEWSERTSGGKLLFYNSLAKFVSKHAKDIQIDSETSADFLVGELEISDSYRRTHEIIEQLRTAKGLSVAHVEKIIDIAETNPQFSDIIGDDDIQDFFADLYEGFNSSAVGQDIYEILGGGYV